MAIKKLNIILFIAEIVLVIITVLVYYLANPINSSKVVYIPKGPINKIISYLEDKSFSLSGIDSYIVRFIGKPQSGWIDIGQKKLSRGDFLYKLTTAKAPLIEITLIPGETTTLFLKEVAEKLGLSYEKLKNEFFIQSPFKEGVILPETYHIPKGIDEKHLIYYLVNNSLKRHKEIANKIFGRYEQDKWFGKYITIASIIQKEAANEKEMPLISSVIYNRLKKGMPLQMDGALNYGDYSHTKITRKRIQSDLTRFNTYKFKGLPPYPVCNVSLSAIKAAVFPAKTEYLYFVKSGKKRHKFSKTYKNHINNIKSVKK
ncbi:endolytic transglycosylase MltG [Nitrosophilus alvini]|uniref:endolytic transglycosylase MltG n=1 Tax=Nitrosophilus alvini TaxID=2714855 RepID=UPI00190C9698|nr:endolytic transglycosylase MltG [Nitrosophilus alvini]